MKLKFFAIILTVMLLFVLAACGETQLSDGTVQSTGAVDQTAPFQNTEASTEASASNEESLPAGQEEWKVDFEKSLLENYGVTPDHYEDLGDGVYQVYVKIDGKIVPYVAVNSATGDYHG